MLNVKSIENAESYKWGNNCDGWHLLKSDTLNVIEEHMPVGTSERLHYHSRAQQLFYILSGTATFEFDEKRILVKSRESLHIPPGIRHRIMNEGKEALTFLLISEPPAQNDRINL